MNCESVNSRYLSAGRQRAAGGGVSRETNDKAITKNIYVQVYVQIIRPDSYRREQM